MKINKFFPFAFIYFFINSLGLPFGLTFTAILSPLFYWWIITTRKKEIILPFFICLAPFFIMHFILGVDLKSYIISVFNFTAVYIFCQAFYTFLKDCANPEKIFRKLLVINFILCIIAVAVYFTSYDDLLWMENSLTRGVNNFKRLKLFTYEASYYATLFTPLFFFYFLQIILKQNKINSWLLLLMLLLPYILSLSIGVIGSMLVSAVLTYILYFKTLSKKRRTLSILMLTVAISLSILVIILVFFPDNSLFLRLENLSSGEDTSGKGRTSDAFILANQILEKKSTAWGVGPGQIKILGGDIVRSYYLYDLDYNTIAIPNAAAETLAIFGWVGFCIRILIELSLFFYTKVWKNYYRLLLFLFIFLYQFTGSFITNVAEYVIWILAFTNAFPQFDVRPVTQKNI
ncbi:MAG TPA: hypothetical protein VMY77_06490 [Chitinophagaceae bacterium]|nr:hypothetical protein [Chitinophagaceae bacterium]